MTTPPQTPNSPLSIAVRIALAAVGLPVLLVEGSKRIEPGALGAGLLRLAAAPLRAHYDLVSDWLAAHPKLATAAGLSAVALDTLAYRAGTVFLHNEVIA